MDINDNEETSNTFSLREPQHTPVSQTPGLLSPQNDSEIPKHELFVNRIFLGMFLSGWVQNMLENFFDFHLEFFTYRNWGEDESSISHLSKP